LVDPLLGDRRRPGVASALDERESRTLDVDELARGVTSRPARAWRFANRLDAVSAREARCECADPLDGRAGAVCLSPGHHSFRIGECGLLLGQSLRAEHGASKPEQSLPRRFLVADAPEERLQLVGAETVLCGAGSPVLAKLAEIDVLLPLPRLN